MMRRRLVLGAVALGAGALGAGVGWWRTRAGDAAPGAAEALYAATLLDASGQPVSLAQFRGRPLVINFWATWCAPCVKEMPELSRLRDSFAPRGLETLGIAIDSPSSVREFAARQPVSYPLVVGGMGGTDLLRAMGDASGALPFTVLLDAGARVAWRHLGAVVPAELRKHCERVLAS